MKLTIVGGGGFRVPLVYGALLEKAERLGLDEVVLHDVDAGRLERIGAVLDGPGRGARRAAAVPVDHRPRRRGRGRGLRVLRRPRRAARGPRRRRERAARARRARPGDDRPGRDLLRAADDPGDGRAGRGDGRARARRVADQLHQPGRDGHRGRPAGARRPRDRRLRLARRGCAGASAAAVGRDARELWFDYFGLNHLGWLKGVRDHDGELLDGLLADDAALAGFEEGRLFGGDWLRSLGMIPNEYLYYFYYAADTVGRDPRAPGVARRVPARAAGAVLRGGRRAAGGRAGRLARDAARPRADVHGRGARRGGRRGRARGRRERRLRARGDGRARGDRAQHARGPDPQHREPEQPAVPRRPRGRRGAGGGRPRGAAAGRGRRGARARAARSSRR